MVNYILRLIISLILIVGVTFILTYPICHDFTHTFAPTDTQFDQLFKIAYIGLIGGTIGYFAVKYLGHPSDAIYHN